MCKLIGTNTRHKSCNVWNDIMGDRLFMEEGKVRGIAWILLFVMVRSY